MPATTIRSGRNLASEIVYLIWALNLLTGQSCGGPWPSRPVPKTGRMGSSWPVWLRRELAVVRAWWRLPRTARSTSTSTTPGLETPGAAAAPDDIGKLLCPDPVGSPRRAGACSSRSRGRAHREGSASARVRLARDRHGRALRQPGP